MRCSEVIKILNELAPISMACEWDNPGLLVGRNDKEVKAILLALDVTDSVIDEAIKMG
ncbi:MAG: Nif3-like dinuclear metal center hexameric protein, partial [Clostridium sp.]